MNRKQRGLADFKKAVAERDKMVAGGMEKYVVRLYEATVTMREGCNPFEFNTYHVGGFDTIEEDERFIKSTIKGTLDDIVKVCDCYGRKIKLVDIKLKLIKEQCL
jgi:hypothetical protein